MISYNATLTRLFGEMMMMQLCDCEFHFCFFDEANVVRKIRIKINL